MLRVSRFPNRRCRGHGGAGSCSRFRLRWRFRERGLGIDPLSIFGDPAEINAYRTLIKSFNEEEPDIDVQLVEASDREDLIARLSTSIAGGSPPDLFLMNYRFYGQFAARDALEPMASYLEDSDVFEDGPVPEALDAFKWGR